jgi:hypothetical protein
MKSRGMGYEGHAACTGEIGSTTGGELGKSKGKKPLEIYRDE